MSMEDIVKFFNPSVFSILGILSWVYISYWKVWIQQKNSHLPCLLRNPSYPSLAEGTNTHGKIHLHLLQRLMLYVDGSKSSHSLNKSRNVRSTRVTTGRSFLYQDLFPKLKPSQNTKGSCAKEDGTCISNTH